MKSRLVGTDPSRARCRTAQLVLIRRVQALALIDLSRSICVFDKLLYNRLLGHSNEHLDANQLLNGWQTGSTLPNFRRRVMPERPHCINTGMRHTRDLTDEQWKTLDPLIPKPRRWSRAIRKGETELPVKSRLR
jgi:hypothetical protein